MADYYFCEGADDNHGIESSGYNVTPKDLPRLFGNIAHLDSDVRRNEPQNKFLTKGLAKSRLLETLFATARGLNL
jgi:hypothetical protein